MLPQHRHYYEIIRQGAPCHLYFGAPPIPSVCVSQTYQWPPAHLMCCSALEQKHKSAIIRLHMKNILQLADLEYQKEHNQDVDGDQLVKALLELCSAAFKVALTLPLRVGPCQTIWTRKHFCDAFCRQTHSLRPPTGPMRLSLQERFDVQLEDSWVIELDSSTPAKFSRHLIIQIPGMAFQSNFHVGAFVKDLCEAPQDAASADSASSRLQRPELLVNKVCTPSGDGQHQKANRVVSLWHLPQDCDPQAW